jgi:hypothetical protein
MPTAEDAESYRNRVTPCLLQLKCEVRRQNLNNASGNTPTVSSRIHDRCTHRVPALESGMKSSPHVQG